MTLTVGSLFSGIGGLDLGLERAGMEVIWQSEIDPYACRVLKKHWPEVPNLGDIKQIDWGRVERPAVICGGYPCQPFSQAGSRKGEEDSRHLWPWVRQAISELRPDYAILENVRGHLSLGGTTVIADLAAIGYDAEWRIVSAASVGAAHRRDRIIIVAYPTCQQRHGINDNTRNSPRPETVSELGNCCGEEDVANTDNAGNRTSGRATDGDWSTAEQGRQFLPQREPSRRGTNVADTDNGRCQQCEPETESVYGTRAQSEREYRGGEWWKTEPDVGRVAHGIPSRVDRLRGLGNAVVPQVAEVIGRLVVAHHNNKGENK